MNDFCELPAPGGVENNYGKINILLQTYISRGEMDSFSLISDSAYVAQVKIVFFMNLLLPSAVFSLSNVSSFHSLKCLQVDLKLDIFLMQIYLKIKAFHECAILLSGKIMQNSTLGEYCFFCCC